MKITLKNFRCYSQDTFDFGDEGITLLSGSSGAGKTSILLGIYFALFGTGTKLVSHGKSSCKVILEYAKMTITRTKRPNRLVVKNESGEYEDDAAQSIINKLFGDTFKTTGYIAQNTRDSFIMMSPIEKLGFIEQFAFKGVNISQIKKRCKDLIRCRNEALLKTTSQLEMASMMIQQIEKPKEVKFPIKCSHKNRERTIKNEIIRNKNTAILIKRCKKKLYYLQTEKQEIEVYLAKKNSKQDSLDEVIEKISDLTLKRENIETIYEGNDKIKEYENKLELILSQRELIILEDRYAYDTERLETMKEDESVEIKEKIKKIEESIWKEYTEDDVIETINDYKQILKDLEKISELESDLERYEVYENVLQIDKESLENCRRDLDEKKKLYEKLVMQQQVLECPKCQTNLRLNNDMLEVYEIDIGPNMGKLEDIDTTGTYISKLEKKISTLEISVRSKENKLERYKEIGVSINDIKEQYEDLPSLKEMSSELEYIRTYKSSQKELDRQVKKFQGQLKNKIFSSTILSFERDLCKQKKKIDSMRNKAVVEKIEDNEETLRDSIVTQKNAKNKLEILNDDIVKLSKRQNDYTKQINEYEEDVLTKFKSIREIDAVNRDITTLSLELVDLETKKEKHQENVDNIEKYEEYNKALDIYKSWETKVESLTKEETENRHLYAASTMLKESILEAESIAMLNVISSINTHIQPYLECFFPSDPLSIKLVPFKETKKGTTVNKKPQINLQIEYKGMEADINMLSGGELSRVILAFALSLGEMFNTPIMLLDECTSSLDQELTGVVMDGIRENFNGNLVLLIAHQVVKGQFDKVIQIGV